MRWLKIAGAVFALGIAALIVIGAVSKNSENDHDDQVYAERRQIIVDTINAKAPGTLSVEGDTIVVDVADCGPNALRALLANDDIVRELDEANVHTLRCKNTDIEVNVR